MLVERKNVGRGGGVKRDLDLLKSDSCVPEEFCMVLVIPRHRQ